MKYLFFILIFFNILNADAFSINSEDKQRIKNLYTKKQIVKRINNFHEFFKKAKNYDEIKKLNRVNNYINRIIGKGDKTNEWITPKEFLIRGRGDCEDYAITKYFALKKLNIDTTRLYLSVVKVKGSRNYHMVLLYVKDKSIYVLDNLSWKLVKLKKRRTLVFYYAFNQYGSYIIKNDKFIKEKNIRREEVVLFRKMLQDIEEGK